MADYDCTREDIGNVRSLEHVNIRVPDRQLATLFYVMRLGLTRYQYLVTGTTNMWINVGRSQFHLSTGDAQVVRGRTGLNIPGRAALLARLAAVSLHRSDTRFSLTESDNTIYVSWPSGKKSSSTSQMTLLAGCRWECLTSNLTLPQDQRQP